MLLTFAELRAKNLQRLPKFKNSKGKLAHDESDGSDWTPAQWLQATLGELGEYANIRKKYERGDMDVNDFTRAASDELADVITYLDILAYQVHVNLNDAVIRKFNATSKRAGCPEIQLCTPADCACSDLRRVNENLWVCTTCGARLEFRPTITGGK